MQMQPSQPISTTKVVSKPKHILLNCVELIQPEKRFFKGKIYVALKRLIDLLLILVFTPVWVPLFCLCALMIKLESLHQPVFIVQRRTGKGGQRFDMFKFRTMVPNADELKESLRDLNELEWPDFKIKNDPRITRAGKILRKTSLDELPQLFNILKGDMSLVGPRPTSFSPETYSLWQTERLDVLPGLTGLWQVVGRGKMEFDDRLRLDIAYIDHRCAVLDLLILFFTVHLVIAARGN